MDKGKRVLIVDVMHLAYKAAFGNMPALSATVMLDGRLQQINTVIPTYVIKQIHRWSKGGVYPTMICFDGKGSNKSRKAYFRSLDETGEATEQGYKGGREGQNDQFYQSINLTYNLLHSGGVGVLKAEKFEADDLVKAAVDLAKATYPDHYIDIVTGDADLIPLVDEQVSVFKTDRKRTYAVDESLVKNHYTQLTPVNYSSVIEDMTAYKKLQVPYNTILLTKLLRGDKSDGIAGYPKFTPTKYNALIEALKEDGVDLGNTFRYGCPIETYLDAQTGQAITDINSIPKERVRVQYSDPVELTNIINALSNHLDDDQLEHVRKTYRGMNLNGFFFDGLAEEYWRKPAKIKIPFKGYMEGELQKVLLPLRIHLPHIH